MFQSTGIANQTALSDGPRTARYLDGLAVGSLAGFALAAPWSIAGAQISVGIGILALLLGWIRDRRWESPKRWPWTIRWIGVFLGVQALSILFADDPAHALHSFRGSWTYSFPLIFYLLLGQDARRARRMATVLATSGALAGLYAIYQSASGHNPLAKKVLEYHGGLYMAPGTLGHHLTFAGVMLPIFFVALGLAFEQRSELPRAVRAGLVVAVGAGLLLCFARSGWIGAAVGLLVFAIRFGPRAILGGAGALALAAGAAYQFVPAIRERLASVDLASGARFHLWESAWNIGLSRPLIGGGLGSWRELFAIYKVPGDYMSTAHPHNDVLNVLVETGFTGALVWLAIWAIFFWETRTRSSLGMGITAGVVALLVGGVFQCFSTDEEVAQAWMFVVALGLTLHAAGSGPNRAAPENGVAE
ncbi:MAG: O-antigen ligase family protein [Candidatus Eisenbacteria bacterium]|uniref:O-antigen ligase family protein n=1 Tax=Eiseniibacteriota bacterium TaxID=2212470 RepID=A0A956NER3_UNCEI|nr:O-antigen ligase family protein [Candidatus Eisenbacteria bacterium]MCB9462392.1 O-antigen ligase family protein [Candidatus Eisenbacteria bacterium]